MKRATGLVELSRRDFCALAAAGLALAGCTSTGPGAILTGGLKGSDGEDGPDASTSGVDANMHMVDGGIAATCPQTGVTDVGAPTTFTLNTPVYFSNKQLFIVRDSGGLYAVTAVCTHEGAICDVQGSQFYCPRHGAEFTFDGVVTRGPANKNLVHYSMCTLENGHVGVTSTVVAATQRLDA